MYGILSYSIRTYSLSRHCEQVEWHDSPYSLSCISRPIDFDARLVDADIASIELEDEFKDEFSIPWQAKLDVESMLASNAPSIRATDIVWYCPDMSIGIVILQHSTSSASVVYAKTLDEFKRAVTAHEC